jgi:hypothetical protein
MFAGTDVRNVFWFSALDIFLYIYRGRAFIHTSAALYVIEINDKLSLLLFFPLQRQFAFGLDRY